MGGTGVAEPPSKAPKMTGAVKEAVKVLASGKDLDPAAASEAMKELMRGDATPAQTGAFLALLSLDRCTPEIVHALADVMRESATRVEVPAEGGPTIDIVGTGGDGQDTFNVSTAAALLAAGAGARVVKHGNRSASSKSGSADFIEALGARLELPPADACRVLSASNFTFLFARTYHPSMRFVGPARAELGIRTVFNILGPLTNPGKPDCMLCGVFTASLGPLFLEVFRLLGMRRALVVHGLEVLDELSIEGSSKVWELTESGEKKEYEVTPADFGIAAHPLSDVASGDAQENAKELWALFEGGGRAAVRDMVLMNAGAALYLVGAAADFKAGAAAARVALEDGRAAKAARAYVSASSEAPAAA